MFDFKAPDIISQLRQALGLESSQDSIAQYKDKRRAYWAEAAGQMEPHIEGETTQLTKSSRPYESAEMLQYRMAVHRSATMAPLNKAINDVSALVLGKMEYVLRAEDRDYLDSMLFDGLSLQDWINTYFYMQRVKDPNALIGFWQYPSEDTSKKPNLSLHIFASKDIIALTPDLAIVKTELSPYEQNRDYNGNPRPAKLQKQAYKFFAKNGNALLVVPEGGYKEQLDYLVPFQKDMLGVIQLGGERYEHIYKSDFSHFLNDLDATDEVANNAAAATAMTGNMTVVHREMKCGDCQGTGQVNVLGDDGRPKTDKMTDEFGNITSFIVRSKCKTCQGSGAAHPFANSRIILPIVHNIAQEEVGNVADIVKSFVGFLAPPVEGARFLAERADKLIERLKETLNIQGQNLGTAQSGESKKEARAEKEAFLLRVAKGVQPIILHLLRLVVCYNTYQQPDARKTGLKEAAVIIPSVFIQMDTQELEAELNSQRAQLSPLQRADMERQIMKSKRPGQIAQIDLYADLCWAWTNGACYKTLEELQQEDALGVLSIRDRIAATQTMGYLFTPIIIMGRNDVEKIRAEYDAFIKEQVNTQMKSALPPLTDANSTAP